MSTILWWVLSAASTEVKKQLPVSAKIMWRQGRRHILCHLSLQAACHKSGCLSCDLPAGDHNLVQRHIGVSSATGRFGFPAETDKVVFEVFERIYREHAVLYPACNFPVDDLEPKGNRAGHVA